MLNDKDEHLHTPKKVPLWRESYYFNVMDPKNKIFSVSTMGYMPTEGDSHFFSTLYVDDKLYTHINYQKLKSANDFAENPSDGSQSFMIVKDLKEWKIRLKKRNFQLDYIWTGRFPVYEYPGGWQISGVLEQQHYEQSGKVLGAVTFKDGTVRKIEGLGHRDHSWGLRNWVKINEWYWTSVQFENGEQALNCWLNVVNKKHYVHGFISSTKENIPITKIDVQTQYQADNPANPKSATFQLTDKKGNRHELTAETVHLMTLPQSSKEGTCYIYETISKFEMDGQTGYGVAEYLKSVRK
ncbi:MAG: hypothetical protein LUQ65_14630 [Candidatus Helarchaeota archaeon]|nr:hypothetical protein [Candidatus Helarchaeota archaeon]